MTVQGAFADIAAAAILLFAATGSTYAESPVVSNVYAEQLSSGTKPLQISYDVLDADSEILDVTFALSSNGGLTYDLLPSPGSCVGDVGSVTPGTGKTIYWDVMADHPGQSGTNYWVKVIADDRSLVIDLGGGVVLELARIDAGSFAMGSTADSTWSWCYPCEQPVHAVNISYELYVGKYEVTQEQWQAVMGTNPSHFTGAAYPVEQVSWDDCQAFIAQLNAYVVNSGQGPATFRLPSEAEWEFACRAGTTTRFYSGEPACSAKACVSCDLDDYAWWCGNNSPYGTKPVGGTQPNDHGLYDMMGNVLEWCQDYWHDDYTNAPVDGSAWESDVPAVPYRVIRGGYWNASARYCNAEVRLRNRSDYRHSTVGLRVVRDP